MRADGLTESASGSSGVQAVIGLGANLGDRLGALQSARDALRELSSGGGRFQQSSIYRTEPVGCPQGAGNFFNAVVVMTWVGTALDLLAELQRIERAHGRVRSGEPNEPRTLDLDLLVFGGERMAHPDLVLPHPRLHERSFVLEPLAEIDGEMQVVKGGEMVSALLTELAAEPLERVEVMW